MTQLVASLCPYALQKKVDNNNRPGTVFMFVDKSGNVVEAKEYDEREYNRKEAKTPNNPAMRKIVNPASKSYTTSVQQRALQIVNDATKRNNPQAGGGLQNVSGQKMSPPFVSGKFRIASGNCGCLKANEQPQKASSLRKRSVSYICPEPSAIGRIKSKGRTSQKDNADEKALVKAKPKRSKTKPSLHRKPSAKYAAESLTSSTDNNNNDGVWFECNVPFRVKIPFPLCTQKLFGMMPLPAGINMNGSSTLPKGKAIAEAKPVARGGGPPSYASMCITMIPAGNSNATPGQFTSPGESTSPPVDLPADPKEKAAGKPKKTTEKKLKGVKKCAVCETCTQTANGMDAKALANPLLSCLEQIEKHLSAENENALKRPGTQSPKCEGRCFAEKSTSVGSVEGTARDRAAPSAAAAPKNGKTKTPLMTRKMKPPNGVNQRSPRNSQDKSKSKDKPIEPQSAYTGKADPTNVTGLRGRMEPAMCFNRYPPCPRAMMYRRMQACNAPQNMPSRMLPPPPPPSGKLQASEPKKSVSDIITSDIRSSQNYALSSVSQMGKKSHTTSESSQDEAASNSPEQAPGLEKENSLLSSLPKTTSDDSRNSDRTDSRCCTVCRPEGGVSDTQWNDKHSGRSVRNQDRFYNDRRQESNSKLQQTEERHQFDHFSLPGRARNRDEYPHQRMMGVKMNSCQAKENRTKQRSQSAPSTITYRYEGQHNGEPAMARLQSKKINVGRQVSGSGEEDVYATTMAANMEIINHEMGCQQQQQPLVLVPFRVENKNSGQTLAICKGREWRKLTLTKITKVTPQQFRIVSGYCNRAPTGPSGGVPRASPRFARAAPRRASSPAAMPGRQCRPMQGHAAPRAYPSSCLRCPRHTNGPLSNRNARNPVACNRCARTAAMKPTARNVWCCQAVGCRNHSTSVNSFAANGSRPDNRGCLQAAGRSNIPGPTAAAPDCSSQRGVNASIDSISISRTYSAGPSSRSRTPSGSEQTLTDQSQFSRNKRSIETVTLMQPRPLRSNESLQNDSYDEPEGRAMEEPQLDSAMENQFPTGFGPPPPPCHFQCLQYATVPPLRNQNSSMGDFASSQQEFQIGVGYQSQPQSQQQQHSYVYSQQSCVGSVCSNATGLIDPRDFLPTVSASLRPNQMPMGVYQSYQPEQTYQRVPCQQPTDMYGSQNHFYGPEDLKESIRIMPMGFYEQTINKYKINPLDSNFRPPSLGSDFLQLLQQQLQQQNQQQHQQHQQHQHEMQFNACPHGNQSQQQQQSASVYGYGNHHCVHHSSSSSHRHPEALRAPVPT
ncbi:uncharacterized protein LOC111081301 [Drosophila obscura]|uniref:uncharacterized protein LOC111081301 n=1 Tax=Drosophila obscura TaxID=7282 RepID=UPI001BB2C6E6|nr:uncharacterized protein LOC111081301 [Drosophila obscura]